MKTQATMTTEETTILYDDLEAALHKVPNYRKVYAGIQHVVQQVLLEYTRGTALHLSGAFAKMDYLLKEHKASQALRKAINDTRVRLRKRLEMSDEELQTHYLEDAHNVADFVAFLSGIDAPDSLQQQWPTADKKTDKKEHARNMWLSEYMRVIVMKWDEELIEATSEEWSEEPVKIAYTKGNQAYDFDWTYLRKMLYEGAQLNLIRPRLHEGVLYPELIILEPDYLVDISTVARCFTNYAESPFVHLINKLQPSQNSEAIVLGNLAGQLLDEAIHDVAHEKTYQQSVMEFFKGNAFNLLTAGIGKNFHEEAKNQKQHIEKAIQQDLPQALTRFDAKEGMVEPSFYSEMLGLQGRMDYLQYDFKVLLEQKSGKGEFPYDSFITPKYKEDHYVQMLLYMALIRYNFRTQYERNGRELHAFLLYTKYANSLLGLGFAPELIFRAIKVRNGLAWTELHFCEPDAYRMLETLTPENLNLKHVSNKLWNNFQYGQLDEILRPIQQASSLEKDYFFRFLTFISNEHAMSKLGNQTKENSGFASKWHDTLEEKRQAGNIYDRLTLISPHAETVGNVSSVRLSFAEDADNIMSNFRVGDIVILYPYSPEKEPDARRTIVYRSTIADIQPDTLTLSLRATQTDARVFWREEGKLWAIEHDFMEASYSTLYRGMHAFLTAPKDRRDLWLLQREPEVDTTIALKGDYGDFNELSLRVKQARDLFLIIGPPGTGKTSFGMLNTLKEELLEPRGSVLLLSYTNRAVDEICSKLYQEGIDFIRLGAGMTCAPEYRDHLLRAKVQSLNNVVSLQNEIVKQRVFVSTTSSLNSSLELFRLKTFSLAIIDEASQILEPHLIGLLSAHNNGLPAIRKMVFIGDHKQLPAVVQQRPEISAVNEPSLHEIALTDCRLSLFERLLRRYGNDPRVTYMLHRQGRMHPDIAHFPNIAFYGGKLTEVPLPHQLVKLDETDICHDEIERMLRTKRINFIDVPSPIDPPSDKVNQGEADLIAHIVKKIFDIEAENFDTNETVGIIVPYRNQIATVRNTLDRYGIKALHDISIDTVERFQGSQRKYILYGFTIQKPYQLNFLTDSVFEDVDGTIVDRKLNVAMTRAEEHLIMLGNKALLSRNPIFKQLIEFTQNIPS